MIKSESRKLFWSTSLGNLFEHYDIALFGFLSPFLATLIFPEQDPLSALILTYMIIPLSMLARPIGALVFGVIGDHFGRKYALFLTLLGMAIVSFGAACIPNSFIAPLFFILARVVQNFLSAGETMGGAIFLLENSEKKRHDLLSGFYGATTMAGHLLASFGVFIVVHFNFLDPGWRFLYLCGCVTALFGASLRRAEPRSSSFPTFSNVLSDLKNSLKSYRKPFFYIVILSGFGYANYTMALVLMNGFIPLVSELSKLEMMKINTYLIVLDMCALLFFGWLASKVNREKLMLLLSLSVISLSIPLLLLLQGGSLLTVIFVRVVLVILGVAFFAPFYAWAQEQIPSQHRYTLISLGYAIGTQGLGSPMAAFSLFCFKKTGMISSLAWYPIFLGFLSSIVLVASLREKNRVREPV